jgi:hypothetical protein
MAMSEYTEEQAEADADALVARLSADPALRDALVADPRSTLEAEGLPAQVIDDLERAMGGAEVEGFAAFAASNFHMNPSVKFASVSVYLPAQFGTQTATCAGGTTSRGPDAC